MKKLLFALHGFLGEQSDWDFLRAAPLSGWHLLVPDYTRIPGLSPVSGGIENWGAQFVGWKRQVYGEKPFAIIGYSQGGRLALTALAEQAPECLGGVIISANAGMEEAERSSRKAHEEQWAQKFENGNLDAVIKEWEGQKIFSSSKAQPQRSAERFEPQILGESLRSWGLSRQPNLRQWVNTTMTPLLWVTGQEDKKYQGLSEGLSLKNPNSKMILIPQSGHRVHFDQPENLRSEIFKFISGLESTSY